MKHTQPNYWKRQDGFTGIVVGIMTAVGAAVSAAASFSAAHVSSVTQKFNARIQDNNAKTQAYAAQAEAARQKEHSRRLIGAQQAALANAGVDIEAGSATDITYDTQTQAELDRLTILYRGEVGSQNSTNQASLDRMNADQTMTAGYLGLGGSILGGIAATGSAYNRVSNNPRFNTSDGTP